ITKNSEKKIVLNEVLVQNIQNSKDPDNTQRNTICYVSDKCFICPSENERCIRLKDHKCALALYSDKYPT
ncbi:11091_t:CDS:1, partial [Entrophospora sp. SA101]